MVGRDTGAKDKSAKAASGAGSGTGRTAIRSTGWLVSRNRPTGGLVTRARATTLLATESAAAERGEQTPAADVPTRLPARHAGIQSNRTLDRVLLAVLVLVGGFLGGLVSGRYFSGRSNSPSPAAVSANSISAHKIVLVDDKNRPRVQLGFSSQGASGVMIFDEAGKQRAGLYLSSNGATRLTLADDKGAVRVSLNSSANGESSGLGFLEPTGKARAVFGAINGSSGLDLTDSGGKRGVRLELRGDGSTAVMLLDSKGDLASELALTPSDAAGLTLFSRDPQEPVMTVGSKGIRLTKEDGKQLDYWP